MFPPISTQALSQNEPHPSQRHGHHTPRNFQPSRTILRPRPARRTCTRRSPRSRPCRKPRLHGRLGRGSRCHGRGRSGGRPRGRGVRARGRRVSRGGDAVLFALLLDGGDAGVGGAVVVASEEVDVLGAQAGVVGGHAGVDLALDAGYAGVEDAGEGGVSMRGAHRRGEFGYF